MWVYYSVYVPLILWMLYEFTRYKVYLSGKNDEAVYLPQVEKAVDNKFIFVVFAFFFVGFIGLRGLTGSDTPVYKLYYDSNMYPVDFEKGYRAISEFFSSSGIDFTTFQILIAILTIVPLFLFFYNESPNLSITVFMFYNFSTVLYAINISRQIVAVSFFVLGVMHFYRKGLKNKLFGCFLFFIGLQFHKTIVIAIAGLIPIYIIYRLLKKYDRIHFLLGIFLIIGILVFYKSNSFYNLMVSMAGTGSLASYTSFVTTSSAEFDLVSKNIPTLLMTIVQAIVFFMPSLNSKKIDDKTKFLLSVFFLLTFTQSFQVSWITERLTQYYVPFTCVLVAKLMSNDNSDKYRTVENILFFLLFFIAGFIWLHRMVVHNFGTIYPYMGV